MLLVTTTLSIIHCSYHVNRYMNTVACCLIDCNRHTRFWWNSVFCVSEFFQMMVSKEHWRQNEQRCHMQAFRIYCLCLPIGTISCTYSTIYLYYAIDVYVFVRRRTISNFCDDAFCRMICRQEMDAFKHRSCRIWTSSIQFGAHSTLYRCCACDITVFGGYYYVDGKADIRCHE